MINYKPEVIAFWEKFKDVETREEWSILARELDKFKDPACRSLIMKCLKAIEKRYNEKIGSS